MSSSIYMSKTSSDQRTKRKKKKKKKSDFSVSLCPFGNWKSYRHTDTWTHGHKMDTELDKKIQVSKFYISKPRQESKLYHPEV